MMSTIDMTFWPSLTNTTGVAKRPTWEKLRRWFAEPVQYADGETNGWSCGQFILDQRRADRCVLMTALVLDFDDGKAPRSVIDGLFSTEKALVHTSKSHTSENQSYRVLIALSRPVTPSEYALLWQAYTRNFADRVDQAAKDCSRFWFVPCKTDATEYDSFAFDGKEIDVDVWIDEERKRVKAAEMEAARNRSNVIQMRPRSGRQVDVFDRASRYVEKMDAAISGSAGHAALWSVALALVRGFALQRHEAESIIVNEYNPRCQPPWSAKEIAHKLEQAERARSETGYLIGNDPGHEYRTQLPVLPECPAPIVDSEDSPDGVPVEEPAQPQPICAADQLGIKSIQALCLDVLTDIDKPKSKCSCKTGIHELDHAIGGFRPGMVTVMGAPTNFGKTTFSIMAADISSRAGQSVVYCTFEDAPLLYGRRIISRRTRVNATSLRDGEISQDERRMVLRAAQLAEKEPFMLDCRGKSAEWTAKALLDVSREFKVDLVVVDYIQRIRSEKRTQDRRTAITYAAELLSDRIKEINAAGLILSQLKRLEDGKRPDKNDLKESGDIENMAEHIIMGYSRPGQDGKPERIMFLDKNKDGPLVADDIVMRFDDSSASFLATSDDWNIPPIDADDLDAAIGGF